MASSESVLAKHFEASAKRGIVLSARQLADYARRRGLQSVPLKTLRQMRHRFKFTALSSRHVRPPRYASSSIMTYGAVQVDAAWMFKKRASVNGGAVGFLGYDMVRFMENLPDRHQPLDFPDSSFMVPRIVLVHDSFRQTVTVVCWVRVSDEGLSLPSTTVLSRSTITMSSGVSSA